jgi:hypothetical protein
MTDRLFWSEADRDVMARLYPAGGVAAVQPLLGRTKNAIYRQASRQNLTWTGPEAALRAEAISAVAEAFNTWPALGQVGIMSPSMGLVMGVAA